MARAGLVVDALGIDDDLTGAMTAISAFAPDVVFNLCESLSGDARFEPLLPMLLERAGIAYTGSPPLALGLALHKHKAKDVLRGAGVPTPDAHLPGDAGRLGGGAAVPAHRQAVARGRVDRHQLAVGRARPRRARPPGGRA